MNPNEALWRTLIADKVNGERLAPSLYGKQIQEALSALRFIKEKYHYAPKLNIEPLSELAVNAAMSHFQESVECFSTMSKACWSRRFATTGKRYMGIVPCDAQVGDRICVMYGSETPFILRSKENGLCEFICLCHIRGFDFDKAVTSKRVKKKLNGNTPSAPQSHFDVQISYKRTQNFVLA
jgi:hypothetical protein